MSAAVWETGFTCQRKRRWEREREEDKRRRREGEEEVGRPLTGSNETARTYKRSCSSCNLVQWPSRRPLLTCLLLCRWFVAEIQSDIIQWVNSQDECRVTCCAHSTICGQFHSFAVVAVRSPSSWMIHSKVRWRCFLLKISTTFDGWNAGNAGRLPSFFFGRLSTIFIFFAQRPMTQKLNKTISAHNSIKTFVANVAIVAIAASSL